MKVGHDLGEETFFMDDENKNKIEDDFTGESFFMDDNKLRTSSAQKRDVHELHSDIEEDEVQEVELSSVKKNSASKIKETSISTHASVPHVTKRQTNTDATNGGERTSTTLVRCFLKNLYGEHERHERNRGRFSERFGKGRN
jgi:hypothetical protein